MNQVLGFEENWDPNILWTLLNLPEILMFYELWPYLPPVNVFTPNQIVTKTNQPTNSSDQKYDEKAQLKQFTRHRNTFPCNTVTSAMAENWTQYFPILVTVLASHSYRSPWTCISPLYLLGLKDLIVFNSNCILASITVYNSILASVTV